MRLRRTLIGFAALALVASACGSGDDAETTEATEAATEATTAETEGTTAATTPETEATEATEPVAVSEKYGGTLVVGQSGDPESMNPFTTSSANGRNVFINVYESLVRHDLTTYEYLPALAESWEQSADGLTWTFQLRDVNFHDGRPFTADDAVYSMNVAMEELSSYTVSGLQEVTGVEALDERTLQMTLSAPSQTILSTLVDAYMIPTDFDDFDDGMIGTGPFAFVRWDRNQSIVLERNENYWRSDADGNQLPYLDGIEFRPIPDGSVAALELADGGVQLLPTVDFSQYDQVASDGNVIAELPPGVNGPYYDLRINTRAERLDGSVNPLGDKRVRQALSLATDRPALSRVTVRADEDF